MGRSRLSFLILLKVGVTVCLFLSVQKSWAGFHLYKGYLAFKDKNFSSASQSLSEAMKHDSSNPELLDLRVRNSWHLGLKSKNKMEFKTAIIAAEQLNRQMPDFGRSWLYRALSWLHFKRLSQEKISQKDWQEMKKWVKKAYEAEPGNPWMGYMTARVLLSGTSFLSPAEKQQALDQMKKNLRPHYPHQASPYLDGALRFLWRQFSDFEILKYVTPPDVFSYYRLLEFMERHQLWAGRDTVWQTASELSKAAYTPQCEKAEGFLKRGNIERALFEFHVASWINNGLVRAKAGILVCRQYLQGLDEDLEFELKQILEDEEEDLRGLLDFMGGLIVLTEDPYLRGLYFFRLGDFSSARLWLEIAAPELKHKFQRRYLAASYWQLGEHQKAVHLLKKALGEKAPDLRELFFFKEWDTPYRPQLIKKIKSLGRDGESETAWRREGYGNVSRLDRKGDVGIFIPLKPGRANLRIPMRAFPDPQGVYPYLRVQLWDHDRPYLVAESYRNHREWKAGVFPIKTTGGNRLLLVELVNGAESPSGKRGPVLELGPLEIEYQE